MIGPSYLQTPDGEALLLSELVMSGSHGSIGRFQIELLKQFIAFRRVVPQINLGLYLQTTAPTQLGTQVSLKAPQTRSEGGSPGKVTVATPFPEPPPARERETSGHSACPGSPASAGGDETSGLPPPRTRPPYPLPRIRPPWPPAKGSRQCGKGDDATWAYLLHLSSRSFEPCGHRPRCRRIRLGRSLDYDRLPKTIKLPYYA